MGRIAVIGAGMGAMAAAARLAIAGHSVVVLERGDTYGGAVGSFARDGFTFDTGPGLLLLPAVQRDLFVKTGKEPLERCVELSQVEPASRHVFADGTEVFLPHASRAGVAEALDTALGGDAGALWAAFVNRARDAWDRARRPLLEEPLWPNWEVLAEREPYPALPRKRLLRRDLVATTVSGIAELELAGEPRLRALLESYPLEWGLDPRTAPAGASVLAYLEQTFGVWSVGGGMRELARAVHERCLARRVEFRFGTAVTRIVEKDGRAVGVELADGSVTEADHVVAGVAPAVLAGMLPGTEPRAPEAVPARPGTASRLTVMLALRGARPEGTAYRTVVHTTDRDGELDALSGAVPGLPERPTVAVLSTGDPAGVPDAEHEAVTLTATVAAGAGAGDRRDEVLGLAERMIDTAGRAVPRLRERLLWHEVRTPADIEEATGAPGGAVPAPALAAAGGRLLSPSNTTRVPGLYTVGGWSHPGGGLPHAGMSGALVAGLIVEGPEFRGSQ
ncbi:NAD(P)/FAD-dependent oxidoreductase [Streptomyces uncialis]|uniref:phytoene desaturase family protein n=1 Tax=Streptomyces uncialis TaxID=1048205 RepID=UPI002E31ACDE|nr:NAD(P)/FAD-dependent oxidoreductase [Streptomyces uncialis]